MTEPRPPAVFSDSDIPVHILFGLCGVFFVVAVPVIIAADALLVTHITASAYRHTRVLIRRLAKTGAHTAAKLRHRSSAVWGHPDLWDDWVDGA